MDGEHLSYEELITLAGQIIERGKDIWLVRVYLGKGANNKRKYHNKTIHGNKKSAQAYLNKVLHQKDTGTFNEQSKELLSGYLEKWLENSARPKLREKTYQSYKSLIRLYINPQLGDLIISQMTPINIQNMINGMIDKGLSARTIRYAFSVLRSALGQAVKWQMIYRNPTEYVDLPKSVKREMKVLSTSEVKSFLAVATESRHYVLFSLLITTGLRPGEALGLKWNDIDFINGKLRVQRALVRNGMSWALLEPKTAKSRRTIPIPPSVLLSLREHRTKQAEELLSSHGFIKHDFVFSAYDGEPLNEANIVKRHFKPLLKKAGLDSTLRLYDLRHTCATLLLSAGEHPKIVSERLGHSSITMTLDVYSHVLPDMQEGATTKLERMLFHSMH